MELSRRYPPYREAQRIIDIFEHNHSQPPAPDPAHSDSDVLEIVIENPSLHADQEKSAAWCKLQLQFCEDVSTEALPPIVKEKLKKACELLKNQLANIAANELKAHQEKIERREKSRGILGKFGSFLSGFFLHKKDQFLIDHESAIVEYLNVDQKKNIPSEIEIKYAEKKNCLSLSNDPEVKKYLDLLEFLYSNYKRSLALRPLLSEYLNKKTPALFNGFASLKSIEANLAKAMNLLNEELDLQNEQHNSNASSTLEHVKKFHHAHWQELLKTLVPVYSKVSVISQEKQNIKTHLYERVFQWKLDYPVSMARDHFKELLNSVKSECKDDLPDSVFQALLDAQDVIVWAYKEWEADRILTAKNNEILGVHQNKKGRYKELQLLLHPDKNKDLPVQLLVKIHEASKRLSPELYESA